MKQFKIEITDNQIENFKGITLFEFRKKYFFSRPRFHLVNSRIISNDLRNPWIKYPHDIDQEIKNELKYILKHIEGTFEIHEILVKKS